jgi:hypothetical protein
VIQNRDTIQYFLTFDDLITYFYFGKGLGAMSISGIMFSNENNEFLGIAKLNNIISQNRGKSIEISFGNVLLVGVLSSSTFRVSGDLNTVEFELHLDLIDHTYTAPKFSPSC